MTSCYVMWKDCGWLYFRVLSCNLSLYLDAAQPGTAPSAAASITACWQQVHAGLDAYKGIGVPGHTALPVLEDIWGCSFSTHVSWEQRWLGKPMELQLEPVNFWTALYRQPADCINSPVLGIFWSLNAKVGCLNIILTWFLFFSLMEYYTLLQLLCLWFHCALVYSGCLLVFVWNKI